MYFSIIFIIYLIIHISSALKLKNKQTINPKSQQFDEFDTPYVYTNENNQFSSFIQLQAKNKHYLKYNQDLPSLFYHDFCVESNNQKQFKAACNQDKCPQGIIDNINFAWYGSIVGNCPNYQYQWKCAKEVNYWVKDRCIDKEQCDFLVDENQFKEVPWTSNFSPPEDKMCEKMKNKKKKLAVIFSCKCQNEEELDEGEEEEKEDKQDKDKNDSEAF